MRGILINPFDKTIKQVEYDGDYRNIYKLLSDPPTVDTFTAVNIGERNSIWLDDEGLFQENQRYFKYNGLGPYAGKGLILAANAGGDSVETKLPISEVQKLVEWVNVQFKGIVNKSPRQVFVPGLGKTTLFESEAQFDEIVPTGSADPNAH
jgi:hypothetical protein